MSNGAGEGPRLYNSLTRRLEALQPLHPPRLGIYACGPTVYDEPHLGNFRTFVWVDVLARTLSWRGFDVHLVMNVTDVDDKIIAGASSAGRALEEFTAPFRQSFHAGLQALKVRPADAYPRATAHVDDMIALVGRLLQAGHAYRTEDGSVFFSVESFPAYGKLARLDPDEMLATARVGEDDFGKHDPRDFALWKAARPGEPSWEAPFGRGRPGWHIECSAMSMRLLGDSFDLHLGGADLLFPHHENEIAQSEAVTGKPLARMWLHCSHLVVNGTKMSKSLGNFLTLPELVGRGHDPAALRFLLASVHYRRQLNFTDAGLQQAAASVARLRDCVLRAETEIGALPEQRDEAGHLRHALETARRAFREALDDDLNTSGALGHLFSLVREANTALDAGMADAATMRDVVAWIREVDCIWQVLPGAPLRELMVQVGGRTLRAAGPPLAAHLEAAVLDRLRARARREFAEADRLRELLTAAGVILEDTADGVRWKTGL